jgi:hypothetical protein
MSPDQFTYSPEESFSIPKYGIQQDDLSILPNLLVYECEALEVAG